MDVDELRRLIRQREPENLKLDFKQVLPEIDHVQGKVQDMHWDELIKDILAIANGNVGTTRQPGYLIIGIADELNQQGTRDLYDVGDVNLTVQRVLKKVNSACRPPLPNLYIKTVLLEGKKILVITIPPTPHLHETIRPLKTTKTTYHENTVFIRRNEGIGSASTDERQAILAEKKGITLQKPQRQTKQTPFAPPKPDNKKITTGWLALLGILICIGLLSLGIVMSMIFSAVSPRQTSTQAIDSTASQVAAATPQPTPILTNTPEPTDTPKATDTPKPISTNTPVVPPTGTPTLVVPPTDAPTSVVSVPTTPLPGEGSMTVDEWEVRVERIEFADRLTGISGNVEKAAGRFALVFLAVTNHGLSNDTFVAFGSLEIQDGEGRKYGENFVASGYASYQYDTDSGVVLNPDETGFMVVAFDIPKRSDTYTLVPGSLAKSSTGGVLLQIP